MKKVVLSVLIVSCVSFLACKKTSTTTTSTSAYTPDCSGTTPTYASNVSSLIASACATSGCHNASSHQGPGALTTYAQIKSAAASIRATVVNASMPQGSTLTTAQKNTIVCWIDAGANNN